MSFISLALVIFNSIVYKLIVLFQFKLKPIRSAHIRLSLGITTVSIAVNSIATDKTNVCCSIAS